MLLRTQFPKPASTARLVIGGKWCAFTPSDKSDGLEPSPECWQCYPLSSLQLAIQAPPPLHTLVSLQPPLQRRSFTRHPQLAPYCTPLLLLPSHADSSPAKVSVGMVLRPAFGYFGVASSLDSSPRVGPITITLQLANSAGDD